MLPRETGAQDDLCSKGLIRPVCGGGVPFHSEPSAAPVAARSEQVRLHLDPGNHGDHRICPVESGRHSITVDVVTLDGWFSPHDGSIL